MNKKKRQGKRGGGGGGGRDNMMKLYGLRFNTKLKHFIVNNVSGDLSNSSCRPVTLSRRRLGLH